MLAQNLQAIIKRSAELVLALISVFYLAITGFVLVDVITQKIDRSSNLKQAVLGTLISFGSAALLLIIEKFLWPQSDNTPILQRPGLRKVFVIIGLLIGLALVSFVVLVFASFS